MTQRQRDLLTRDLLRAPSYPADAATLRRLAELLYTATETGILSLGHVDEDAALEIWRICERAKVLTDEETQEMRL